MFRLIPVLLSCIILYGCGMYYPELEGEVKTQVIGDTLVVDYKVIHTDPSLRLDSLFFRTPVSDTGGQSDSLIFIGDSTKYVIEVDGQSLWSGTNEFITGQLKYPTSYVRDHKYMFRSETTHMYQQQPYTKITDAISFGPHSGIGLSAGVGFISLDKSILPDNVRGVERRWIEPG